MSLGHELEILDVSLVGMIPLYAEIVRIHILLCYTIFFNN